jgi:putative SOS response-associated peptidase YedK
MPEEIARHFELREVPALRARFNVAPMQPVPVVRATPEGRHLDLLRWGLVPPWAEDPRSGSRMINARAERAASAPAFRAAMRVRRCLVPADGFYEWQGRRGERRPFHLHLVGGGLFAFAGLWERWRSPEGEGLETCCVLTTEANARVRPIHERMPVILAPAAYARWLDPELRDPAALADLLRPLPDDALEPRPVGLAVNDARRDDASCLQPPAETPLFPQRGA